MYPNHPTAHHEDSNIHRHEDIGSLGDQWHAAQTYGNLMSPPPAYDFDRTSTSYPMLPCTTSTPVQFPVNQEEVITHFSYPSAGVASQPLPLASAPEPMQSCHVQGFIKSDPGSPCTSSGPINMFQDTPQTVSINTFPTPSELLYEIQSNEATSPASDSSGDSGSTSSQRVQSCVPVGLPLVQPTELPTFTQPARDGISSHEKKRQLLECLEQYVLYLHEQLALVGVEPVPLERTANYRGLSSRSIRTLLVHTENMNRKLNSTIVAEEERFLRLREALDKRRMPFGSMQSVHPGFKNNVTLPFI
ncbi:hypothetical protein AAF712_000954 [Marasmius tenuissimus]|uniref:BHLH domain-containing protein n=1 Tax=Marasmius tenuissimus TaxID=585030 RepID=A0ABR3AF59_9AGAR